MWSSRPCLGQRSYGQLHSKSVKKSISVGTLKDRDPKLLSSKLLLLRCPQPPGCAALVIPLCWGYRGIEGGQLRSYWGWLIKGRSALGWSRCWRWMLSACRDIITLFPIMSSPVVMCCTSVACLNSWTPSYSKLQLKTDDFFSPVVTLTSSFHFISLLPCNY